MNLWLAGMESSYKSLARRATDGKIIITAGDDMGGVMGSSVSREAIIENITEHGGEVLEGAKRYGGFAATVVPAELVSERIEVDIEQAPDDAAPVLVSTFMGEQLLGKKYWTERASLTQNVEGYKKYREELIGKVFTDGYGTKYYVVGLAPGNYHVANMSFQQLEKSNDSLLNLPLEMVPMPGEMPIVIDNGKSGLWQKGDMGVFGEIFDTTDTVVAVFDGDEMAYEYLRNGKGRFMTVDLPNREYAVSVVAGMSPEVEYIFGVINSVAGVVSVALGLIAAAVVIFTSVRLVDQDKQIIRLYYNLGATPRQVWAIYLCYFLGLMGGALVLALGVATGIVVWFGVANQEILEIQGMLGFGLANEARIWWYGMNAATYATMGAMLGMAAVCVLVNGMKLRPRH